MMKKIINYSLLASFSLLIFWGCSSDEEAPVEVIRPVVYHTVGFSGGEMIRAFSGTAQTDKIINLSFRSSGIITELNMKLGDRVKRGDLLGQLDNVQARLAYEQAVSQLNSAASQMNTAELNLKRIRSLYEKGSASLSDFENAKNSFRTAQASHLSAQRSVDIQQEQINHGFLFAPEDAAIASVNVELEENINPGQVVGVLNAGLDMNILLGIPEVVINRLQQNMEVNVTFSALPNSSFLGTVVEISPALDSNTSTYPVEVSIQNPTSDIKSGMAASVTFNFSESLDNRESIMVPAHAVGGDQNGRFVFLIDDSSTENITVEKNYVEIGELTSEGFEILSGLSVGNKIATAGLQTLLNGQKVTLYSGASL